jgi:hypothetical protein
MKHYFALLLEKQGAHGLQLIVGHIKDVPKTDAIPSASTHF